MRLFAAFCFAIALYFGYTSVETMRSGVAYPLRGDTSVPHHREDSASQYSRYLAARWLLTAGFVALGVVMHVFAGRFEKLTADAPK